MSSSSNKFYYSDKYFDGDYEYRHVSIPKELAARVPKARLMDEAEWRGLGIQQSLGWQHYMIHKPEPHIILFRRPLTEEGKKDLQAERNKLKSFCEEEISGEDIMRQGRRTGIENVDNNRLLSYNTLRQ